jgi:hypothetical protein
MSDVVEYVIQFAVLLLLSAFAVGLVGAAITFAFLISHSTEGVLRRFWNGPGVYVAVAFWIGLTLGFFLAVNWADSWGISPAVE